MTDSSKKHVNRVAKANYPPRFVSTLFAAGILVSVEHYIAKPIPYFWPFIVIILLWPHIAYLAVRSSKAKKNPEHINIYLDSFICAFALPLACFNFWVLFTSLNVLVSNSFRPGGYRKSLISLIVYLAGVLIGIALYGFNPVLEFGQITMILSLVCISCYFVLLSSISRITMNRLFRSKEYLKNTHAELETTHFELEIQNDKREKLIEELQKALTEIKTLRGILPVCCVCGLIRDDTGVEYGKGEWMKIDKFVHLKTDAEISHNYCPKCYKKAMEDF